MVNHCPLVFLVCTMGMRWNHRGRACRRSKGVSVAYSPADATATHSLAALNPDWFYLPGFYLSGISSLQ